MLMWKTLMSKNNNNNNGKKNNSMDVLSDKQVTSHTTKRERGQEVEILREKLNLF